MTRTDTLIAKMTLSEKIGQMTMASAGFTVTGPTLNGDAREPIRSGRVGNVLNVYGAEFAHAVQKIAVEESRLGIPLLCGFDAIHGHRTLFPIPLGETATFDPVLWEKTARVTAEEAATDGVNMVFGPMLDIARDARWGRIAEGPGEDPFIGQLYAQAKIRGLQGADLSAADSIAATAKHFVAYGAPTGGLDYGSVDISERQLREVYLPPFEAAISAGTAAIMPAFMDFAGTPMTANAALLQGWLRKQMGFEGVLISDYDAIRELIVHGVARDQIDAAVLALRAGIDIEIVGNCYAVGLPVALERGLVAMTDIDAAVRRVLALKERLGLFDAPYGRGSAISADNPHKTDRLRLAREVARRSIVLLANQNEVLPIALSTRRVAVVGPFADAPVHMRGSWTAAGDPKDVSTILEGIRGAMPKSEILYARGVNVLEDDGSGIDEALNLCRSADVTVLCVGESAWWTGEAASRALLDLPGRQQAFAEAVQATGKPVVLVLCAGRPLTMTKLIENAGATLMTWFLGNEAGHAIADVLTGRFSPTGRLPVTWPRAPGQVPIYYSQRPSGRPANPPGNYTLKYLDLPLTPLFPFGHGLSYGKFSYSELRARPPKPGDEAIEVRVTVKNEGKAAGEETVFLFAHPVVASNARPVMELKSFAKIALEPGASGTVVLALPLASLRFPGNDWQLVLEPGEFDIFVGGSADRTRLLATKVMVAG